jgi:DNA polymerase-4
MYTRKILHLDLDAFFCAVEELRDPSLRGKAFAVGGRPESRGVVASCSYAARAVGVRSAMSMWRAQRLCPELIIVSTRHGAYGDVSHEVMARLHDVTPLVQQLSIDEAFCDVTDLPQSGEEIARALQARIRNELGLPSSLGIASNKLVAKIANTVGKSAATKRGERGAYPNAITVVPPGTEAEFLAPLPCDELWGVGPKTAERLRSMGLHTIGDIARAPEKRLVAEFGKHGADLAVRARGRDESPIVIERERKSVSQETTYVKDVHLVDVLRKTLFDQAKDVSVTLQRKQMTGSTVKIKLRWADFTTLTRQQTLDEPTSDARTIYKAAVDLLAKTWDGRPVRLLGVGVSNFTTKVQQATLFDQPNEKRERLDDTLKSLRARFGDGSVKRASEIDD